MKAITHEERMAALARICTRIPAMLGPEPSNPPGEKVEWCAMRKNRPRSCTGPIQARVRARIWFEARRLASLELGVHPEELCVGQAA